MKENMSMVYSSIAMILVFGFIVWILWFGNIFGIEPIGLIHWIIVVGLSVLPIIVAEIGKFIDNYGLLQQYKKRLIKPRELDI